MLAGRLISVLKSYGWATNLVFIGLGAYSVAQTANQVVAQKLRVIPNIDDTTLAPPPKSDAQNSPNSPNSVDEEKTFAAIAQRNLMNAKREELHPVPDATLEPVVDPTDDTFNEADLKPCTMPGALRGTIVANRTPWSVAVIFNNTTHEAEVYSTNPGSNEIAPDTRLLEIRYRAVVIRRKDHAELCESEINTPAVGAPMAASLADAPDGDEPPQPQAPTGDGVRKVSDTDYEVDRKEVDDALSNLSQVATQARIVPSFKNGKPNGFKLFSIKPNSIFSRIGLQNGDVIQAVNGYTINSPDKALELYQKLRDASSLSIELQRRGQTKNMSYNIR